MTTLPCRLIVCEKASHFAPALRRELGPGGMVVVETRSIAGCDAALSESPESLVAVEVSESNLAVAVESIQRIGRCYPRAVVVVLLSVEMRAAEMLAAEAGASGVFHSVLEAPRLAKMALKKLALVKPVELTPQQLVAQRMPWSAQASA